MTVTYDEVFVRRNRVNKEMGIIQDKWNHITLWSWGALTVVIALIEVMAFYGSEWTISNAIGSALFSIFIGGWILAMIFENYADKLKSDAGLTDEERELNIFLDHYAEYSVWEKAREILQLTSGDMLNVHYSGGSGKNTFWQVIYYVNGKPEELFFTYNSGNHMAELSTVK